MRNEVTINFHYKNRRQIYKWRNGKNLLYFFREKKINPRSLILISSFNMRTIFCPVFLLDTYLAKRPGVMPVLLALGIGYCRLLFPPLSRINAILFKAIA